MRILTKASLLLCGLLAATALVPAIASAGYGQCDKGEFCLYYSVNRTGGVYNFAGSDRNLWNDHYEGAHTGTIVANTSISVWNRGQIDGSGKYDVIVYDGLSSTSARRCIPRTAWGDVDNLWWQAIEGYQWVTRAQCNKVPRMPLRP